MNYKMVDSDNHYYEAEDAFTRHGDEGVRKFVRWVVTAAVAISSSEPKCLRVCQTQRSHPLPNRGRFMLASLIWSKGSGDRVLSTTDRMRYGELEPIPDYYRDREARLVVMDGQNLERCILFPTLGVGVEGLMSDNVEMAYRVFHAFNRWIEEDGASAM